MDAFLKPLRENENFINIEKAVLKGDTPVNVWGITRGARPLLMEGLRGDARFAVVVTYDDNRAEKLYQDYRFYDKNVYIYPAKDALFYYADVHGNVTARKRLEIVKRIINRERSVIILTVDALMDKIPDIKEIRVNSFRLKRNEAYDFKELRERLSTLGYEEVPVVEGPGDYSVRGGLIDIFPLTEDCPYRIEFWDDTIDSIRSFEVDSQRSIEEVNDLEITPASEYVLKPDVIREGLLKMEEEYKKTAETFKKTFHSEQYGRITKTFNQIKEELAELSSVTGIDSMVGYFYKNLVSFIDYFPEDTLFFIDEADRTGERARAYSNEFSMSMQGRLEGGYILPGQADVLYDYKSILAELSLKRTIILSDFIKKDPFFNEKEQIPFETRDIPPFNNSVDELVKDLNRWRSLDKKVIIVSPSKTRGNRFVENLIREDIPAFFSVSQTRQLKNREVMITTGSLEEGYEILDEGLIVISESEIFTTNKDKKKKKIPKYSGQSIADLDEINVGDYVVHERHGIGIYRGIEKVETEGRLKDYITIDYANNGKLFIPVDQLSMIGKFSSKNAAKPRLNKLGGGDWEKTRTRVKSHVDDIAEELINLYAARRMKKGHVYSEDTVWQTEFEELFPYDETDDQLRAIEETKKDMESDKIMDRLICGDVGFGKTEVAIRAAFKAVQDNMQVAYLVPTTLLCQQHFENFLQRMRNYPVNVRMLSRFCTPKEIKETLEGLEDGTVDIVIGTHRLLSKDVKYKRLGLLIIDEEQRFGVKHKEKIKELKNNVDVLTLTATPIPRTLHMSLVGIRDMSLLEEAPVERRPIQTYVMEYDKEIVKEAVKREIARGGQVYYVYNRVDDIDMITNELRSFLPDVNIEFAHGKMHERELESIMHSFINKEIDVLVSTTIIETGLDIRNANTIIIHNAENFGLSQLYQLRGRVGRSDRSAYAFLMYRKDKMIKEVAEKRLKAIREFTDLGSGYKISLKDLEIRGAGNVLGSTQSGHMEEIGYDLYVKMLNNAIRSKMGEKVEEEFETGVDLPVDAFIQDDYVKNEFLKLEIYKRISKIEDEEDADLIIEELKDRFGELPKTLTRLINVSLIRAKAHKVNMTDIKYIDDEVRFLIKNGTEIKTDRIPKFLKKYKGKMRLIIAKQSGFALRMSKLIQDEMLENISMAIDDIYDTLMVGNKDIEVSEEKETKDPEETKVMSRAEQIRAKAREKNKEGRSKK